MRHYDCAVVGSGPAGQRAAIQAAKLGKSVCVIEKSKFVGGVMVNTGTIPSKALREAVMHLTGHHKQGLYGRNHRVKRDITINDLASMSSNVIRNEWNVIQDAFDRNDVDLIWGRARFEGPNLVVIENDGENEMITADTFILGVGTKPAKPQSIPFDNEYVMCSDGLLKLDGIPKSMIVVGGGVIGTGQCLEVVAPNNSSKQSSDVPLKNTSSSEGDRTGYPCSVNCDEHDGEVALPIEMSASKGTQ